jgi:uncharacterized protein YjbI with pentapeptide repeats
MKLYRRLGCLGSRRDAVPTLGYTVLALVTLVTAVLLGPQVTSARADCTEFAQPDVQWRHCLLDGIDLSDSDLTGADLRGSSFKRTDLSGAILVKADARRAKFVSTSLKGAVLDEADLTFADLTNADLSGASLRGTSLRGTKLFSADLRSADLTGAILDGADLLHADLSLAVWVDGSTVCAERSVGRCTPSTKRQSALARP